MLATPATVARDYTRDLIETYAAGCKVNLVGSRRLAGFAEAELAGSPVSDEELLDELGPCFIEDAGGRTDVVALSCTHYPLLLSRFQALAPWPVTWIDPAPAIARRVTQLIGQPVPGHEADENETVAVFTSGAGICGLDLREASAGEGLCRLDRRSRHMPSARSGDDGRARLTFPPFPPKCLPFARSSRAA